MTDETSTEAGSCDDCGSSYLLADAVDHCVAEGLCWQHCTDPVNHEREQDPFGDEP